MLIKNFFRIIKDHKFFLIPIILYELIYFLKGYKGFKGMCPPNGKHVYRIKGYALNDMIKKKPKRFTIEKFEKKYKELILESFLITGTYK